MDLGAEVVVTPENAEETAKIALESAKTTRIKACQEEVEAVLKKHSCTLDLSFVMKPGQVPVAQLNVISL